MTDSHSTDQGRLSEATQAKGTSSANLHDDDTKQCKMCQCDPINEADRVLISKSEMQTQLSTAKRLTGYNE